MKFENILTCSSLANNLDHRQYHNQQQVHHGQGLWSYNYLPCKHRVCRAGMIGDQHRQLQRWVQFWQPHFSGHPRSQISHQRSRCLQQLHHFFCIGISRPIINKINTMRNVNKNSNTNIIKFIQHSNIILMFSVLSWNNVTEILCNSMALFQIVYLIYQCCIQLFCNLVLNRFIVITSRENMQFQKSK